METPFYPEIQEAIFDYYDLKPHMSTGGPVMSNYPKVLAMTLGSTFENVISNCIDNFLDHPITNPTIYTPSFQDNNGFTRGGNAYKLFHTIRINPTDPEYNAQPFYDKFGENFKSMIETEYSLLHEDFQNKLAMEENNIEIMYQNNPKRLEVQYEDFLFMKDAIDTSSFSLSEQHMLMIKRQRNIVAHNFVDSFPLAVDDLRQYYYRAMIYVKAIENVFKSQTG